MSQNIGGYFRMPVDPCVLRRLRRAATENMVTPRELAMLLIDEGLHRIANGGAVIRGKEYALPDSKIIDLADFAA